MEIMNKILSSKIGLMNKRRWWAISAASESLHLSQGQREETHNARCIINFPESKSGVAQYIRSVDLILVTTYIPQHCCSPQRMQHLSTLASLLNCSKSFQGVFFKAFPCRLLETLSLLLEAQQLHPRGHQCRPGKAVLLLKCWTLLLPLGTAAPPLRPSICTHLSVQLRHGARESLKDCNIKSAPGSCYSSATAYHLSPFELSFCQNILRSLMRLCEAMDGGERWMELSFEAIDLATVKKIKVITIVLERDRD
ncbi:PREDICTED: uncharacterized protein LOC105528092 [Mandrillus leucophaeus]|uniref:uncharacterized protein LOC105528092 n=1 Tax=Mandrillus leucophaeus TaxID=9568 RepID=UPI0005F56AA4|nr:PREDICTED: uncharacterized protein LOC105528092 [Mandrillus leucophaeus]